MARGWFGRWLRGRRARGTPIGALGEGRWARIVGVAEAMGPTVMTPVDAQACLGFRLVIDRRRLGSTETDWGPILERQLCPPFSVRDTTGVAVVAPPMVLDLEIDDGAWAGLPAEIYTLLEDKDVALNDRFFDHHELRFSMAVLKPGDRISVEGRPTLRIAPALRAPGPRAVAEVWHFESPPGRPTLIQDVDDGETSG